jgi:Zn ribbon nucleic-acid-binding protein
MVLLILAICIGLFVLGFILYEYTRMDEGCFVISAVGGTIGVIALIAAFILGCCCVDCATVDDRIVMYQEENARIEEQIADIVTQYQQYEKDVFTSVTPDSAMTLVSLYPELKSDSLVASQIEVYIENNKTIKTLKEQSINAKVYRWWMYFGS